MQQLQCNLMFLQEKGTKIFQLKKAIIFNSHSHTIGQSEHQEQGTKIFQLQKAIIFTSHTHTIGHSEHVPFIIVFLSLNLYSDLVYLIFGQ